MTDMKKFEIHLYETDDPNEKFYTFMNKNEPLFYIKVSGGYILNVYNLVEENKHLLPVFLEQLEFDSNFCSNFRNWWELRRMPRSRDHAKTFYQNLEMYYYNTEERGGIGIEELIEQALGLSLSDQYWFKPIDSNILWEDVNYFNNEFSEDVAYLTMRGDFYADLLKMDLKSPDLTCDGMVEKQWKIIDGERYLVKAGHTQPFRERLAYLTIKQLFLGQPTQDYVEYTYLDGEDRYSRYRIYSKCKNFVTPDTEYVPFYQFKLATNESSDELNFDYIKSLYGDKSYVLDLQIILDYIILNRDRHFGNFGLIRDVNTGEFIGPAPIFDNGSSLFYNFQENRDIIIEDIEKKRAKPFAKDFEEMLRYVDLSKYTEGINALHKNAEKIFDEAMSESNERHRLVMQMRKIYLDRINKVVELSKETNE